MSKTGRAALLFSARSQLFIATDACTEDATGKKVIIQARC